MSHAPKDLKALVEDLNARIRELKARMTERERSEEESERLTAENARLERETAALQAVLLKVISAAGRQDDRRHAARLIEIYQKDLEMLRPKGGDPKK